MTTPSPHESPPEQASQVPPPRSNHSLWVGPLLVFTGAVSYFMVFARFPLLRDFPWLNLPIVLIGLILSTRGLWRAYAPSTRTRYGGRIIGIPSFLFSLALTGLFCFYVFSWSYKMPRPQARTLSLESAPDVTLTDPQGRQFRLSDLRGKKVVLTFYRGHW